MARTGFAQAGAATDTQILAAPGSGKYIKIWRLQWTVSAAATVSFTDGNDAAATRIVYGDFAANSGTLEHASGGWPNPFPIATLTANTAFRVTNSAGNIKGVVEYDIVG